MEIKIKPAFAIDAIEIFRFKFLNSIFSIFSVKSFTERL